MDTDTGCRDQEQWKIFNQALNIWTLLFWSSEFYIKSCQNIYKVTTEDEMMATLLVSQSCYSNGSFGHLSSILGSLPGGFSPHRRNYLFSKSCFSHG